MTTKSKPSKVTKLSSTVYTAITAKTHAKHKPRENDYYVRCTQIKGFYIRIFPTGTKTYYATARLGGGKGPQKYPKIGDCSITKFEVARKKAIDAIADLNNGIDPTIEKKIQETKTTTLKKAFDDYVDVLRNAKKPSKTFEDYERKCRLNLKPLANKPIGSITVQDVKKWWRNCDQKRSDQLAFMYATAVLREYISEEVLDKNVFELAKKSKSITLTMPALSEVTQHVPRRHLYAYLAGLFKAYELPQFREPYRSLILFQLLTGKRTGESRHMKWEDVDLEHGTIVLPPSSTKTNKRDIVPLTDYTYVIFEHLKSTRPNPKGNDYVFWTTQGSTGHIANIENGLQLVWNMNEKPFKLEKGTKIGNHDLRRTFSTMADECGYSLADIDSMLSHSNPSMTDKYIQRSIESNRIKLEQVQKLMNNESNTGIGMILSHYYGGHEDLGSPDPDEDFVEKTFKDKRQYLLEKNRRH